LGTPAPGSVSRPKLGYSSEKFKRRSNYGEDSPGGLLSPELRHKGLAGMTLQDIAIGNKKPEGVLNSMYLRAYHHGMQGKKVNTVSKTVQGFNFKLCVPRFYFILLFVCFCAVAETLSTMHNRSNRYLEHVYSWLPTWASYGV
jgi:hypothetical protein